MRKKTMQATTQTTDARTLDDGLSELPDVAFYEWADTDDGAISVTLNPDADLSDAAELRQVADAHGYRTILAGEFDNGATEWRLEVA